MFDADPFRKLIGILLRDLSTEPSVLRLLTKT